MSSSLASGLNELNQRKKNAYRSKSSFFIENKKHGVPGENIRPFEVCIPEGDHSMERAILLGYFLNVVHLEKEYKKRVEYITGDETKHGSYLSSCALLDSFREVDYLRGKFSRVLEIFLNTIKHLEVTPKSDKTRLMTICNYLSIEVRIYEPDHIQHALLKEQPKEIVTHMSDQPGNVFPENTISLVEDSPYLSEQESRQNKRKETNDDELIFIDEIPLRRKHFRLLLSKRQETLIDKMLENSPEENTSGGFLLTPPFQEKEENYDIHPNDIPFEPSPESSSKKEQSQQSEEKNPFMPIDLQKLIDAWLHQKSQENQPLLKKKHWLKKNEKICADPRLKKIVIELNYVCSLPDSLERTLKHLMNYLAFIQTQKKVQNEYNLDLVDIICLENGTTLPVKDGEEEISQIEKYIEDQWNDILAKVEAEKELFPDLKKFALDEHLEQVLDHDQRNQVWEEMRKLCNIVLGKMFMVDIGSLNRLILLNHQQKKLIEGKEVLLLLGVTGSGKTSTLLYLAGEEFEATGHNRFEIKKYKRLKAKEQMMVVSDKAVSQTQSLAVLEVYVKNTPYFLVDTPGFDDTKGLVSDILHMCTIIGALQRAKSVRIIGVFAYSELEAGRGELSKNTAGIMGEMLKGSPQSIQYVFTKTTTILHPKKEIFNKVKHIRLAAKDNNNTVTFTVFDDMLKKITPKKKEDEKPLVKPLQRKNSPSLSQSKTNLTYSSKDLKVKTSSSVKKFSFANKRKNKSSNKKKNEEIKEKDLPLFLIDLSKKEHVDRLLNELIKTPPITSPKHAFQRALGDDQIDQLMRRINIQKAVALRAFEQGKYAYMFYLMNNIYQFNQLKGFDNYIRDCVDEMNEKAQKKWQERERKCRSDFCKACREGDFNEEKIKKEINSYHELFKDLLMYAEAYKTEGFSLPSYQLVLDRVKEELQVLGVLYTKKKNQALIKDIYLIEQTVKMQLITQAFDMFSAYYDQLVNLLFLSLEEFKKEIELSLQQRVYHLFVDHLSMLKHIVALSTKCSSFFKEDMGELYKKYIEQVTEQTIGVCGHVLFAIKDLQADMFSVDTEKQITLSIENLQKASNAFHPKLFPDFHQKLETSWDKLYDRLSSLYDKSEKAFCELAKEQNQDNAESLKSLFVLLTYLAGTSMLEKKYAHSFLKCVKIMEQNNIEQVKSMCKMIKNLQETKKYDAFGSMLRQMQESNCIPQDYIKMLKTTIQEHIDNIAYDIASRNLTLEHIDNLRYVHAIVIHFKRLQMYEKYFKAMPIDVRLPLILGQISRRIYKECQNIMPFFIVTPKESLEQKCLWLEKLKSAEKGYEYLKRNQDKYMDPQQNENKKWHEDDLHSYLKDAIESCNKQVLRWRMALKNTEKKTKSNSFSLFARKKEPQKIKIENMSALQQDIEKFKKKTIQQGKILGKYYSLKKEGTEEQKKAKKMLMDVYFYTDEQLKKLEENRDKWKQEIEHVKNELKTLVHGGGSSRITLNTMKNMAKLRNAAEYIAWAKKIGEII